jgi:hypothetical protein
MVTNAQFQIPKNVPLRYAAVSNKTRRLLSVMGPATTSLAYTLLVGLFVKLLLSFKNCRTTSCGSSKVVAVSSGLQNRRDGVPDRVAHRIMGSKD